MNTAAEALTPYCLINFCMKSTGAPRRRIGIDIPRLIVQIDSPRTAIAPIAPVATSTAPTPLALNFYFLFLQDLIQPPRRRPISSIFLTTIPCFLGDKCFLSFANLTCIFNFFSSISILSKNLILLPWVSLASIIRSSIL